MYVTIIHINLDYLIFTYPKQRLKEPSQHLREPTASSSNAGLLERTQKQDEGLALLRERLSGQV